MKLASFILRPARCNEWGGGHSLTQRSLMLRLGTHSMRVRRFKMRRGWVKERAAGFIDRLPVPKMRLRRLKLPRPPRGMTALRSQYGPRGGVVPGRDVNLVRMTRTNIKGTQTPEGKRALQDAKPRCSESEVPQRITVRGRQEVVVVSVEQQPHVKGHLTGEALVKVLQDSLVGDVSMDPVRTRSRVRPVEL